MGSLILIFWFEIFKLDVHSHYMHKKEGGQFYVGEDLLLCCEEHVNMDIDWIVFHFVWGETALSAR